MSAHLPHGFNFVPETGLWLSDNAVANASTARHGLLPKLSGSSSDVLRGDGTWGTVAGGSGGGLTLLEQHTASASASLDFTTWYSASYDSYQFELVNIVLATDNVSFAFEVSTDGGSSWVTTTTYEYIAVVNSTDNAGAGWLNATAAAAVLLFPNVDNGQSVGINGSVKMFDPANASLKKAFEYHISAPFDTIARRYTCVGSGFWTSTTAVNGIRFRSSSGNITSGKIRIYGFAT
jgi:hypothetical protein